MRQVVDGLSDEFLFSVAAHVAEGAVGPHQNAVRDSHDYAHRRFLESNPEPLFAHPQPVVRLRQFRRALLDPLLQFVVGLPQRFFRPPPLRDVDIHPENSEQLLPVANGSDNVVVRSLLASQRQGDFPFDLFSGKSPPVVFQVDRKVMLVRADFLGQFTDRIAPLLCSGYRILQHVPPI